MYTWCDTLRYYSKLNRGNDGIFFYTVMTHSPMQSTTLQSIWKARSVLEMYPQVESATFSVTFVAV